MGNALEALRRLQRQEASRRDAPTKPQEPLRAAEPTEGPAFPVVQPNRGPVGLVTPVDLAVLTATERQALEAAGLVVHLADGREETLGLAGGVVLSWPLGAVDELGLPLPYLRDGEPVVPFAAADCWKWWKGGPKVDELRAQLVAAGEELGR